MKKEFDKLCENLLSLSYEDIVSIDKKFSYSIRVNRNLKRFKKDTKNNLVKFFDLIAVRFTAIFFSENYDIFVIRIKDFNHFEFINLMSNDFYIFKRIFNAYNLNIEKYEGDGGYYIISGKINQAYRDWMVNEIML